MNVKWHTFLFREHRTFNSFGNRIKACGPYVELRLCFAHIKYANKIIVKASVV